MESQCLSQRRQDASLSRACTAVLQLHGRIQHFFQLAVVAEALLLPTLLLLLLQLQLLLASA